MSKQPNILKRWWKAELSLFVSLLLLFLPEWLLREKIMEHIPTWFIEIAFAFIIGCIVWCSLNIWEINRQEKKIANVDNKPVIKADSNPNINPNIAIFTAFALTLIAGLVILNKRKAHDNPTPKSKP